MRLGTASAVAALTAALSCTAARPSAAADMPAAFSPYPLPSPYGRAAFGTGWYLRGDASFGPENQPKVLMRDNVPTFDAGASAFGYAFGGGVGYRFAPWFRADITGDYLDPFHYAVNIPCGANCAINQKFDLQRWDALVNGYVDLGTYAGLTPYVGAGAGVAGSFGTGSIGVNGAALPSGVIDPRTGTLVTSRVPSRSDERFAYAAMAGVSYAVLPDLLVDVGYRYLDLGRTTVSLFPSTSATRNVSAQQVRIGLRYTID